MQGTTEDSTSRGFGLPRLNNRREALSSEIIRSVLRYGQWTTPVETDKEHSCSDEDKGIVQYSPVNSYLCSSMKPGDDLFDPTHSGMKRIPSDDDEYNQNLKRLRVSISHRASGGKTKIEELELLKKRNIDVFKCQRRRELCRSIQTRYRMRQQNHALPLEENAQHLHQSIPVLELQRARRHECDEPHDMWNIIIEYFEKFRFGVKSKDMQGVIPHENSNVMEAKRQLAFLYSSMTEEVALGEQHGVEALMDRWRRYSLNFKDLELQLKCIQRTSDQFMSVSAVLNVTVSAVTLEKVFPDLNIKSLRAKLLGKRLRLPCTLWFEWNASISRVVRVEMTVNFVTALINVFGSLSDAASVLDHASITPCGDIDVASHV